MIYDIIVSRMWFYIYYTAFTGGGRKLGCSPIPRTSLDQPLNRTEHIRSVLKDLHTLPISCSIDNKLAIIFRRNVINVC
jgi:hypothetical protein